MLIRAVVAHHSYPFRQFQLIYYNKAEVFEERKRKKEKKKEKNITSTPNLLSEILIRMKLCFKKSLEIIRN